MTTTAATTTTVRDPSASVIVMHEDVPPLVSYSLLVNHPPLNSQITGVLYYIEQIDDYDDDGGGVIETNKQRMLEEDKLSQGKAIHHCRYNKRNRYDDD